MNDASVQDIREIPWGGPDGRGLVWTVENLVAVVDKNSREIYGNGGTRGLKYRVAEHAEFVQSFKDNWKWILRLLAAQLVTIILAGGWVVFKAATGGG